MGKRLIFITLLLVMVMGNIASGARPPGIRRSFGTELTLGLTTRLNSDSDLWAIDVPIIEYSLPVSSKYLHIDLAAILQFGLDEFFLDGYSGMTIRFTPTSFLEIYTKYMFSTGIIFGDHYGHILQLGGNMSIPFDKNSSLVLSSGYFWRKTRRLLDYLYTDKFYGDRAGLFFGAALRWKM